MLVVQTGTSDYEAADLALEGVATVVKEADSIEQLRGELATLENRIRQAAVEAGTERVSVLCLLKLRCLQFRLMN